MVFHFFGRIESMVRLVRCCRRGSIIFNMYAFMVILFGHDKTKLASITKCCFCSLMILFVNFCGCLCWHLNRIKKIGRQVTCGHVHCWLAFVFCHVYCMCLVKCLNEVLFWQFYCCVTFILVRVFISTQFTFDHSGYIHLPNSLNLDPKR